MRLRLFERLSRLASRCFGSRAEGRGWTRDSRPRDDAGRHRRSAGATQSRFFRGGSSRMPDGPLQFPGEQPQPSAGFQQPPAGFQEPPGSQPQAGFADRTAVSRPAAGGSRHGGGIGRARIKEAPFGAAPAAMEATITDLA